MKTQIAILFVVALLTQVGNALDCCFSVTNMSIDNLVLDNVSCVPCAEAKYAYPCFAEVNIVGHYGKPNSNCTIPLPTIQPENTTPQNCPDYYPETSMAYHKLQDELDSCNKVLNLVVEEWRQPDTTPFGNWDIGLIFILGLWVGISATVALLALKERSKP